MKSKLLLMVVLTTLVAAPELASAQSVTATATVAEYALISGTGDLAFGTLSRATDNVIDAAGGAGHATRTVDFNHDVSITFNNVPANLTSGTLMLPVLLTCASQMAGVWSAAAPCATAQLDLDVGAALTTATLGFGGTIAAADVATAVAGNYTGTFDIVVTAR
ncbi:MAG TPA: hypothetical protein VFZ24_09120 [Longimicrobiales bacterium]